MLTHTQKKNRKSYTLKALLYEYKIKAELKASQQIISWNYALGKCIKCVIKD